MIVYSTQDLHIFEKIQKGETHYANRSFIVDPSDPDIVDEYFCRAYDWISQRMEEKIGPKPAEGVMPTWAYYQWWGEKKPKPDLRYRGARCFADNRTCALMTLEIPDEDVLLSDYDTWHWVLNGSFLGDESRSDEIHEYKKAHKFHDFEDYPQWLKDEISLSWNMVFDMDASNTILEQEKSEQIIQATFWCIKPEYLKEAVKFDKVGKTTKLL